MMQGISNSPFPKVLFNILKGVFKALQTGAAVWEEVNLAVLVVSLSLLSGEAHYFLLVLKVEELCDHGSWPRRVSSAGDRFSQAVSSLACNGGRKVFDTEALRYDSLQKSSSIAAFNLLREAEYADVVPPAPVL